MRAEETMWEGSLDSSDRAGFSQEVTFTLHPKPEQKMRVMVG